MHKGSYDPEMTHAVILSRPRAWWETVGQAAQSISDESTPRLGLHAKCMKAAYHSGMDTTVVQVRDVPVSVLAALKARAEARGVSLSSFLRDLMASEAAMPPIDEVMASIASRDPVRYAAEDLRSFREDGRR
jgi:hypothetical protein